MRNPAENGGFWDDYLRDAPRVLDFPVDGKRKVPHGSLAHEAVSRRVISIQAEGELLELLDQLASSLDSSLEAALLTGYLALLHRYTSQPIVAALVRGPKMVRASLDEGKDFKALLRETSESLRSISGQVALSGAERVTAGFLFGADLSEAGARCRALPEGFDAADLILSASPSERSGDGLRVELAFDPDRFAEEAMSALLSHLVQLWTAAVAAPDWEVSRLEILSPLERRRMLAEWNRLDPVQRLLRGDERAECLPLHRLFELRAEVCPDRVAVSCEGETLTYAELNARANRLAHRLRRLGAVPESLVALSVERSLELVIGVLGILKAGAAYVPLDPDYPQDRLAMMLADCEAGILVTQGHLRERLPTAGILTVCLGSEGSRGTEDELANESPENPELNVGPENLAYIIYTSGSTGRPKGAETRHRNAVRLFQAAQPLYRFNESDTWTLFHSYAFDFSVWEIWGPLLHGGKLVIVPFRVSRSPRDFHELLRREGVTVLNQTPSAFFQLMHEDLADVSASRELRLRYVILGGEALDFSALRPWFDRHGFERPRVVNGYGPTETTVFATFKFISASDLEGETVSNLGRWLEDLQLYIVDRQLQPVPRGVAGELLIGGEGVSRGYLKRPELTAEKFVRVPEAIREATGLDDETVVYRTGDLARFLPDGQIEYLGRIDQQVKIRGFRIELGEIETALREHAAVREGGVVVREDEPGEKYLAAYYVPSPGAQVAAAELRRHLASRLPEYMVPQAIVEIESLPLSPNGKLDRKALPAPERKRPELSQPFVAPSSALERTIASAWRSVLRMDRVGVDDNFFELGGSSLLATQVSSRLRQRHGIDLPVMKLFERPTVAGLAALLEGAAANSSFGRKARGPSEPLAGSGAGRGVAIIGMAGRFPGASSVEAMWENLLKGAETTSFFEEHELDVSVGEALRKDPAYVRARGVIDGVELFDAGFFGIPPSEATVMDPQHRVFLEIAWEALESSGYGPGSHAMARSGSVGVFAGTYNNSYYATHVLARPDLVAKAGEFQTMVASEKDYVATRTSYKLNLNGPSVSVHTACSTSLVAIVQGYFALLTRQCDLALAGGAAVTAPQKVGHLHQEGSMLSKDGHTRVFDADAQGTVFSDGAAAVVLKRVEDAVADGDTIYAVIRGAALNNDAAGRASFTAPSVEGQASVIRAAHERAGIDPRTISYVEAHGTATPLGDPIEVEGLTQAFRARTPDRQFCALGSVKSNFGHLTIAAGAAGLIKTSLALKNEVLPASLHYRRPNPKIDFASSPFYVCSEKKAWARGPEPRRAGVSSFGVGGTNAHVVLEEAPDERSPSASRPRQLLLFSARSAAALETAWSRVKSALQGPAAPTLEDAAYTLSTGRRAFSHRGFAVLRDRAELGSQAVSLSVRRTDLRSPQVAFLFPGQGSQYVAMGQGLYRMEPAFRAAVDECAAILAPIQNVDLREVLYPADPSERAREEAAKALKSTYFTQPSLFVVEYALARLWMSWGVRPAALAGHSVGEFVAACLAGVFSLEDALKLVAHRGMLMQMLPAGTMLSVRMAAGALEALLPPEVQIASINSPQLCVAAGPTDAISALQARLEAQGAACRPLQTSHAFHSAMMDPAVEPFFEVVRGVRLAPPRIPVVSTVTGSWLTDAQAQDPMYWARHLRETVRFSDAVRTLWKDSTRVLLEVGPRQTLTTLAKQHAQDVKAQLAVPSLSDNAEGEAECTAVLRALGQLWTAGVSPDWDAFYAQERRKRVPLPTYPFERKRYWADRPAPGGTVASSGAAATPQAVASPALPILPVLRETQETTGERPMSVSVLSSRRQALIPMLKSVLEDTSGIDVSAFDTATTFFEMGMDSLFLTQVATALGNQFGVKISFRQLLEEYANLDELSAFLDSQLPADSPLAAASASLGAPVAAAAPPQPVAMAALPAFGPAAGASSSGIEALVAQQLALMSQQLQALGGRMAGVPSAASAPAEAQQKAPALASAAAEPLKPSEAATAKEEAPKAFGAQARISLAKGDSFTPKQKSRLDALTMTYNARTQASKAMAEAHRKQLADPRVVSGFRPALKELVYPIQTVRSSGSKLWDVDGNEYLDMTCGFGTNFFGNVPEFVKEAIKAQVDKGMEIGPSSPLAGELAAQFCEMTGAERVAFCSTGSEAVLGCMRLARTISGRNVIVSFAGDYHGIFDEVVVRGTKSLKTMPAAPGIMKEAVQNVLVLDYGSQEALETIRARAHEIAGVLVEPVQSRNPDLQPREFLHDLRKLTEEKGIALIFDEVITGFRVAPGGAQEHFGVRADLASYGKVIGGGLPMGVIAGKAAWMDGLDGGAWRFGDDSAPTVGVTYFAGTYVRHPLALAAAKAVLDELKKRPGCQKELNARTTAWVKEMNAHFESVGAPIHIMHFSSMMKVTWTQELPYGELLYVMMREKGIHIWDQRPIFLTLSHSEADIALVTRVFKECVADMQESGFMPGATPADQVAHPTVALGLTQAPPVPGARLGRDPKGNPGWFIPDPQQPGKYLQVDA